MVYDIVILVNMFNWRLQSYAVLAQLETHHQLVSDSVHELPRSIKFGLSYIERSIEASKEKWILIVLHHLGDFW